MSNFRALFEELYHVYFLYHLQQEDAQYRVWRNCKELDNCKYHWAFALHELEIAERHVEALATTDQT